MSDALERPEEARAAGPEGRLRLVSGPPGPRVLLDGVEVLMLCSSNYLGLADHPRVRRAAAEAAERYGAGAGGSRPGAGSIEIHDRLERRLAEFVGAEAALLAGSGYLATLGAVAALAGRGGVVLCDELSQSSILEGCRLAGAETFGYRHRDCDHLAWGLARAGERAAMIVTDGVFAADGDVAPLPELAELARRHRCLLCVDDAHGVGALGPGGRGTVAAAGLESEVDVLVGSLGAALGSHGGWICSRAELIELLLAAPGPLAASSAPAPPAAGAALAALALVDSQPGVVAQLERNAALMRDALAAHGLDTGRSRTQIIPVAAGDDRVAATLGERAVEHGAFAEVIRSSAAPDAGPRLRLTVMAGHRVDELQAAAGMIAAVARELGIIGAEAPAPPVAELRPAA